MDKTGGEINFELSLNQPTEEGPLKNEEKQKISKNDENLMQQKMKEVSENNTDDKKLPDSYLSKDSVQQILKEDFSNESPEMIKKITGKAENVLNSRPVERKDFVNFFGDCRQQVLDDAYSDIDKLCKKIENTYGSSYISAQVKKKLIDQHIDKISNGSFELTPDIEKFANTIAAEFLKKELKGFGDNPKEGIARLLREQGYSVSPKMIDRMVEKGANQIKFFKGYNYSDNPDLVRAMLHNKTVLLERIPKWQREVIYEDYPDISTLWNEIKAIHESYFDSNLTVEIKQETDRVVDELIRDHTVQIINGSFKLTPEIKESAYKRAIQLQEVDKARVEELQEFHKALKDLQTELCKSYSEDIVREVTRELITDPYERLATQFIRGSFDLSKLQKSMSDRAEELKNDTSWNENRFGYGRKDGWKW